MNQKVFKPNTRVEVIFSPNHSVKIGDLGIVLEVRDDGSYKVFMDSGETVFTGSNTVVFQELDQDFPLGTRVESIHNFSTLNVKRGDTGTVSQVREDFTAIAMDNGTIVNGTTGRLLYFKRHISKLKDPVPNKTLGEFDDRLIAYGKMRGHSKEKVAAIIDHITNVRNFEFKGPQGMNTTEKEATTPAIKVGDTVICIADRTESSMGKGTQGIVHELTVDKGEEMLKIQLGENTQGGMYGVVSRAKHWVVSTPELVESLTPEKDSDTIGVGSLVMVKKSSKRLSVTKGDTGTVVAYTHNGVREYVKIQLDEFNVVITAPLSKWKLRKQETKPEPTKGMNKAEVGTRLVSIIDDPENNLCVGDGAEVIEIIKQPYGVGIGVLTDKGNTIYMDIDNRVFKVVKQTPKHKEESMHKEHTSSDCMKCNLGGCPGRKTDYLGTEEMVNVSEALDYVMKKMFGPSFANSGKNATSAEKKPVDQFGKWMRDIHHRQ